MKIFYDCFFFFFLFSSFACADVLFSFSFSFSFPSFPSSSSQVLDVWILL